MRRLLVFFLTALAYGCAQVQPLPINAEAKPKFSLVDARDAAQKTREIGSMLITSCLYGTLRHGDDATTPDRIAYLRNRLAVADFREMIGKEVVVKRFTIYENSQASYRRSAMIVAASAGSSAATQSGLIKPNSVAGDTARTVSESRSTTLSPPAQTNTLGCQSPLDKGGVTLEENPTFVPVGIGELIVFIAGKEYAIRVVEPQGPDWRSLVPRTITRSVDELVNRVKNDNTR